MMFADTKSPLGIVIGDFGFIAKKPRLPSCTCGCDSAVQEHHLTSCMYRLQQPTATDNKGATDDVEGSNRR